MIQHSVFLEGAISLRDMRYYFIYRQRKAAVICYMYIFLLSALVYSVYGFPFTVYNNETLELIYNGIFIAVVSLIFTLIFTAFLYLRLRTGYKNSERLKRKRTYTINRQGIQIQSKNYDALFEWNEIKGAAEYRHLFSIKTSSHQLILIPQRFFKFENERHSFRQLVKEHVPAKKVKLQS
ncbi:YcxB family protein [Bacillus inaquosorum]|uniref:YcxB family protein n=1 Tax=Bacillus inaquosorum TaxID=483913 RepID=UPI002281392E|nr:YcxB family protein [Bacillus inaquosorum]MCY7978424.1 YcxB family protein [Bacillus inaquosorum]MCY8278899.1 YcxB family protein [Bacillus inaquosorum]MCY8751924.1 YcxB family protein [Bacillus inaquosorum]MCY9342973.1 YcxB family protein [Bacillus inaquosorum]MEC0678535.1 YcxB family protein [Bacillus inaquosorum]